MCETIFRIYRISGIQIWGRCAQQNAAMRTRTHFRTHFVSLVSGVQSRCLRPFFASTESQESKSDMNIARQCALRYSILDQCCLRQSLSSLNLSWFSSIFSLLYIYLLQIICWSMWQDGKEKLSKSCRSRKMSSSLGSITEEQTTLIIIKLFPILFLWIRSTSTKLLIFTG